MFGPRPVQYDYKLLYRLRRGNQEVENWTEIQEVTDLPGRFRSVWNPNTYTTKALFDIATKLTASIAEELDFDEEEYGNPTQIEDERVQLTTPYLMVLNYTVKWVRDKRDVGPEDQVQLIIMRGSNREEKFKPLFISKYHKVKSHA
ncbi:hypothetical protein A6E15_07535 [Natrinema saccharevitans]|uniref:Uncharacterized protein n=2 Tax=Natrinema saccharevitans TaxID=301967 RepID=A0A1S8AVS1_9EURY|nr:hypothetical protein A6E15_07535 [Natrinema saccharevitans]